MIRRWLKTLENAGREEEVIIPLEDGTEVGFPQSALKEAFVNEMERLEGQREDVHPLTLAMTHSADPNQRKSALASLTPTDEHGNPLPAEPVPDLSE